jgi:hypothetical protein
MAANSKPKLPILWIMVAVIATCGIGKVIFDAASDKGVSDYYKIFLPVFFLGWLWVLWSIQPNLPRSLGSIAEWSKPKAAASVLYVFLSGLVGFGGVVQLVAPQASTKRDAEEIRKDTKEIIAKIDASLTNVARQEIVGLWGEDERCLVTYRFSINDKTSTLLIDSVKRPAGFDTPFHAEGEIQPPDPKRPDTLTMLVRGPQDGSALRDVGFATFTYQAHGNIQELLWNDAASSRPAPYVKCQKSLE